MTPVILYVLGAPGVGKTTLVRTLLSYYSDDDPVLTQPPEPKWSLAGDAVAAGHYSGKTFDGADTIPYNGARAALEYWAQTLAESSLTILDGARFSTGPSLARLRELAPGHAIVGVYLVATDAQLDERRAARGSNQNAAWIKGATTVARNFAAKIGATTIEASYDVSATQMLAEDVLKLVDTASGKPLTWTLGFTEATA